MTALDSKVVLRAATAVVAVMAASLVLYAVNTLMRCSAKLREYVGYSAEVRDLEKTAVGTAAAIRMFEALPDPHPVPLADLLKKCLTGDKYEIVEQASRPTVEGWLVCRREVTLPDIQLGRLGAFLAEAETQRPPWRLESCKIISTEVQGGAGRVSLTFEALEKIQP